jgi:hypothetical protein
MGWGDPPHEGYGARVLRDGRLTGEWSAETNRESTGYVIASCGCGWRGGRYKDEGLDAQGRRWWPDLDAEAEDQAAHDEWWHRHMAPMVDPDPARLLVLGRDSGGMRHFLANQPVHAGTGLELRLADDVWVRVRYEWSYMAAEPPRAYLALGGRGEELGYEPGPVSFLLPTRAELRWPAGEGRGR